jgi:hypothetical protein
VSTSAITVYTVIPNFLRHVGREGPSKGPSQNRLKQKRWNLFRLWSSTKSISSFSNFIKLHQLACRHQGHLCALSLPRGALPLKIIFYLWHQHHQGAIKCLKCVKTCEKTFYWPWKEWNSVSFSHFKVFPCTTQIALFWAKTAPCHACPFP